MLTNAFSATELAKTTELPEDQFKARLELIKNKKGFIIDMDGVIYHGSQLLPGAKDFVEWLISEQKQFLFLLSAVNATMGLFICNPAILNAARMSPSGLQDNAIVKVAPPTEES
ncbi:hypothetical protein HDU98_003743 [Podochytrium sp. JEL0797]|nr:hypothetical protein HDU98_003743 [Podochytrium sp. JEL0797]